MSWAKYYKHVVDQGFLQIILLTILLGLTYLPFFSLCIAVVSQIALFIIKTKYGYFIAMIIASLLEQQYFRNYYLISFAIVNCFPHNNFFQRSIFSLVLCLGVKYNGQSLVSYLIVCICLQLFAICILRLFRLQKLIFYFVLLFNPIAAVYSLYLGKHLPLVNSPNLYNVVIYGIIGLAITVILSLAIKYIKIQNVYARKIFHISPLILFPILSIKCSDIFISSLVGVIYLFVVLELLRFQADQNSKSFPNKQLNSVWKYMSQFLDKRDTYLWITHISLLIGMSISYFINDGLIKHSSVIIPMSDAFAAIIGTKYGRTIIKRKSLEGTAAFILSNLILLGIMSILTGENGIWWKLIISTIVTGIVQLLSQQVDNLLLPLFFSYLYLCL